MELSIIIPYYNTLEHTKELLKMLIPQLNDKTELIIVDDGCHEEKLYDIEYAPLLNNIKIIQLEKNSGGASKPRNVGLDNAKGTYIAFIDSDDMVSDNYVSEIFKKMKYKPDIIYLSWKSKVHNIIINTKPPKWNCSVWCRVFKKELIGNVRFNEELKIAEDWVFVNSLNPTSSKSIGTQIYFYNNGRKGSLINGGNNEA